MVMASIFVRLITGHKSYSIYGADPVRTGTKVNSNQISLGKIPFRSLAVQFNDNFYPWLDAKQLNVDYAFNKINKDAEKLGINITMPESFLNKLNVCNLPNNNVTIVNINGNSDNNNHIASINKTYSFTYDDIKTSKVLEYGHIYLLNKLSDSVGLTNILKDIFPLNWKIILTLAEYFAIECAPCMYCKHWAQKVDCETDAKFFSSQRISDLFTSIPEDSIYSFYQQWASLFDEKDFVALDNTSFSTYSKQIPQAAFGYNRDGDKLKQINLSLLFGQNSGLPIYSALYHGSLNDVKTLQSTINQFNAINKVNFTVVLDKGFFSADNINFMVDNVPKIKFNISLPKTLSLFENLIRDSIPVIYNHNSTLITTSGFLQGCTQRVLWNDNKYLYAHIYLNEQDKLNREQTLMYNLFDMMDKVTSKPLYYINDPTYSNIFSFRKSKKAQNGYIIRFKENTIKKLTYKDGWFILLTNSIKDINDAITIYRKKDTVEKAFNNLKNHNVLNKIGVHSYKSFTSKIFISFISLILISKVHEIMSNNNLYIKYSMKELFNELELIETIQIKGIKLVKVITSTQKKLLKLFDCPIPTDPDDFNTD
jgi:transposase